MYFENVKKNFGFGCMRLPLLGGRLPETHFDSGSVCLHECQEGIS